MRLGRSLTTRTPRPAAGFVTIGTFAACLAAVALGWDPPAFATQAAAVPTTAAGRTHHRTTLFARPAAGGMVIGIDRETGMLVMPEPDELARLVAAREAARAAGARRSRPAPVLHANGTYSLDVHEWMREYMTVGAARDGRPGFRCASGPGAVARAARDAAPPATMEDR